MFLKTKEMYISSTVVSTVFLLNYLSCITALWGRYTFLPLDQFSLIFNSVQSLSRVGLFATPWIAAHQASLSPIPGVYPNSCPLSRWCHPTIFILCRPLLLWSSIFPSIRVFSNESVLRIRCPTKVLEFQLQHQSFQWTPRTDLLYLLYISLLYSLFSIPTETAMEWDPLLFLYHRILPPYLLLTSLKANSFSAVNYLGKANFIMSFLV